MEYKTMTTNTQIKFNYYKGFEGDMHSFYRIPKVLFTHGYFEKMACEAKVLYGLMLDRMSLSIQNKWMDEENKVYIFFSIDDVMKMMRCGREKAVNLMKALEEYGLIEKRRLGHGKANIIYVKNFCLESYPNAAPLETQYAYDQKLNQPSDFQKYGNRTVRSSKIELQEVRKSNDKKYGNRMIGSAESEFQEVGKSNCKKFENRTSRSTEIELQEVGKSNCNYTKPNNTEMNNNSYPSYQSNVIDRIEQRKAYEELIKENIEYDVLCKAYNKAEIDEKVELILETVCTTRPYLKINGDEVPSEVVKKRLLNLNYGDIQYVFHALSKTSTKVKNIRQYMITVLYNAPVTRKQFYDAEVRHDFGV